jgi:hypothetical protein
MRFRSILNLIQGNLPGVAAFRNTGPFDPLRARQNSIFIISGEFSNP